VIEPEEDDWEANEARDDREPAQCNTEKCDACWDVARFIAEVPRSRKVGVKEHEMPPARFRLCRHHAQKLLLSDGQAAIHPLKESNR
jgi:hypothetical protein